MVVQVEEPPEPRAGAPRCSGMDHVWQCGVATLLMMVSGVSACTQEPSSRSAPLPSPAEPVTSAEQIAQRLHDHLVTDSKDGTGPDTPVTNRVMMRACPQTVSPGAPLPPRGVPAFTGHVRVKGVTTPLDVRFWLTSIPEARRLAAGARQAADSCSGHHPDGGGGDGTMQESDNTVSAYARRGWTGVRSLTEGRIGSDTDPPDRLGPFARATTVAARPHRPTRRTSLAWPAAMPP